MATESLCSINGCGKRVLARGWCGAHLYRWRRHGHPLGGGTPWGEPKKFLEETVLPYSGDDCIKWPYACDGRGYGQIYIGGGVRKVTRVVCEATKGSPPTSGHEAAHSCGNGHLGCCTPRHLRWRTSKENSADSISHGTWNHGEKVPQSKLKEDDVMRIRQLKGKMLQREIAALFNITQSNVSRIISGETWLSNVHSAKRSPIERPQSGEEFP